MKLLQFIIIISISFFLIVLVDFFLGKHIANFIFVNDKPVINHPLYHHDLEKNIKKKHTYNKIYNYTLCTNNYGFKDRCESKKKILKKIDYAFIGDSFTEGVGLNYEDTFVGLFSNDNEDKVIINLGVESYSPKIYYKKINHLVNKGFEFERIIIFLDLADILDENMYFFDDKNNVKKKSTIEFVNTVYQDYKILYKFKKIIRDELPLNYFIYRNFKKILTNSKEKKINLLIENPQDNLLINSRWTYKNKFSKRDAPWINNGIEEARTYLDKIFELSKKGDFKISIAIYPWPAQIMFDEDTGREKFGRLWKEYCDGKCEYFLNYLEKFHILKNEIGNAEVKNKYFLKDDVHFNKDGNIIIYNYLKQVFRN